MTGCVRQRSFMTEWLSMCNEATQEVRRWLTAKRQRRNSAPRQPQERVQQVAVCVGGWPGPVCGLMMGATGELKLRSEGQLPRLRVCKDADDDIYDLEQQLPCIQGSEDSASNRAHPDPRPTSTSYPAPPQGGHHPAAGSPGGRGCRRRAAAAVRAVLRHVTGGRGGGGYGSCRTAAHRHAAGRTPHAQQGAA